MTQEILKNKKFMSEMKEIVLARLGTLNPSSKIVLMGSETLTVTDMIEAVENDTELGIKIVKAQYSFLKMITSGEL